VCLLQVLPRRGIACQSHAAEQSYRQAHPTPFVRAQRALQSKEAGLRAGFGRQSGVETTEYFKDLPAPAGDTFPSRLLCSGPRRRQSSPRAEVMGVRHDGRMVGCACARGARVGESPEVSVALAGEDEQYRPGAAAVAGVPATAALVALAGPQVGREDVAAGMAGEVRQCG
jgi:hypothetical protein